MKEDWPQINAEDADQNKEDSDLCHPWKSVAENRPAIPTSRDTDKEPLDSRKLLVLAGATAPVLLAQ